MTEANEVDAGPSTGVKAIIGSLLALLLIAGLFRIELWPLTGWRLYATPRGPYSGKHYAYRVGPQGGEHKIDYRQLPYAYFRTPYLLDNFPDFDAQRREEVCDGLAHGEREGGRPVKELRIYWELKKVMPEDGKRHVKLVERELRYTCARSHG
jgi:hypothetical protein